MNSCDPSHPPMRLLACAYVMSAMGGRLRGAGTWPGEPSSNPHLGRHQAGAPHSCFFRYSELPSAHGKTTWRPTEGRALRAWVASKGSSNGWPGQLLPYSEISPGGVLSLVPPNNTTVPKAGRLGSVLHIGWYTVLLHCPPFSSRPFKGHGKFWCWSAPCSPFSQERQAEEQQSSRTFPVSATTGV